MITFKNEDIAIPYAVFSSNGNATAELSYEQPQTSMLYVVTYTVF